MSLPLVAGFEQAVDEVDVAAHFLVTLTGGLLLAFLFGIAFAAAAEDAFDGEARDEDGRGAVGQHLLRNHVELELQLILLAPLNQFALVVDLLLRHLVDVDMTGEDDFVHETAAGAVAAVEVQGSDEGFEGIAVHVAVVCRGDGTFVQDEFVQSELYGQLVERVATHDLAAQCGEETFLARRVALVEDVGHDGTEDGVAQVFEALVVHAFVTFLAT